jgi:hypothetical protein
MGVDKMGKWIFIDETKDDIASFRRFDSRSLLEVLDNIGYMESEYVILDVLIHYIDDTDKWWATVYYTKLDEE